MWYRVRLPREPAREADLVAAAVDALRVRETAELHVPDLGRAGSLGRSSAPRSPFVATPPALVDSWRTARYLERATRPGDGIVVADRSGLAGMFVLEQASCPERDRRQVVVVAGSGTGLRLLAVAGTLDATGTELDHEVDWELVAYRWADDVVTFSAQAGDHLSDLGLRVRVLSPEWADAGHPRGRGAHNVWLPEPVSRLSRTPEMLRALSGCEIEPLKVFVSCHDRDDEIWQGSAWRAMAGVRSTLAEGLERTDAPPPVDLILLGDPYHLPSSEVVRQRQAGTPVVVAAGSAASRAWPSAPTWHDEDGLASLIVADDAAGSIRPARAPRSDPETPRPAPGRAARVSVAIPVFRDVRFLDQAVRSVLAQSQSPHEVVLVDDGSRSSEVDETLERWSNRSPRLVRVLRQANRGVSAARNRALEAMTGDAFVFLDQDDVLEPDFVAACAVGLRRDERLWAVATWTRFFGGYQGVEAKPPFDRRVGRRENPIVSTAALVDMRVRDLGIRFDPQLAWIYCEDWDFWARIVAAGGAFGLVPRPLVRHRVHQASGGFQRSTLALALGRARATRHLERP